jgi:hypothetical protein
MVLLKIKTFLENNCCTYWSSESCETAFPTSEKKIPWSIILIRKVDITQTRHGACEKNQTFMSVKIDKQRIQLGLCFYQMFM